MAIKRIEIEDDDGYTVYHDFSEGVTGPGSLAESGAWMVHMACEVLKKFKELPYADKLALLKQLGI